MSIKNNTQPEQLSFGSKVQELAINYTNSKEHSVLGFIGGRAIGVLLKPPVRIIDVSLHVIIGVGKLLALITITGPIHIVAKILGKNFNTGWNIKEVALHFGFGILYTFDIFASPIINLINPNIYRWKFFKITPKPDNPPSLNPPVPLNPNPLQPPANPAELQRLRQQLTALTASLDDANQRLMLLPQLQQEKAQFVQQIQQLTAEIAALRQQILDKEALINNAAEETRRLSDQVQNQNDRLAAAVRENQHLGTQLQLKQELADKKGELERKLKEEKEKHEFIKAAKATQDGQLAVLQRDYDSLKKENGDLSGQVARINALNKDLQEMLQKEKEAYAGEIQRQESIYRRASDDHISRTAKEIADKIVQLKSKDAAIQQKEDALQRVLSERDNAVQEMEALRRELAAQKAVADISRQSSPNKLRSVGQFVRWMVANVSTGRIKVPSGISQVLQGSPSEVRHFDQGLTDSVIGEKYISVFNGTLKQEDLQLILEWYRQFLSDQLKDRNAKVIELSQEDINDLLPKLALPLNANQNLLEEKIVLSPEEYAQAKQEIDQTGVRRPESGGPPNNASNPQGLASSQEGFFLMDSLDPILDDFKKVDFRALNLNSLIHYETVSGVPDAQAGITKVTLNGVQWIQYINRPKDEVQGIRFKLSDHLINIYDQLLEMNDHSYAAANIFTKKNLQKLEKIHERHARLNLYLESKGWQDTIYAYGSTGQDNMDPDVPCIIRHNPGTKTIAITFHGSRNGSKIPSFWPFYAHDGHGDWGANYDSTAVTPKEINLDIDLDVKVHKGFAQNVQSVQETIQSRLSLHLAGLPVEEQKKYRIIFTGHSKGAAEANIAALMAKEFLEKEHMPAEVSAVVFSSPRAFYGDDAQDKVDEKLGFSNIVRINVYGDPVGNVPFAWKGGRSAGLLIQDSIYSVSSRLLNVCPQLNEGGFTGLPNWYIQRNAGFHYGSSMRGAGMEFDPRIVMKNEELIDGLLAGLQHMISKKENPIRRAFLRS